MSIKTMMISMKLTRRTLCSWKDNKILLRATGEPIRVNLRQGGMQKLAEEILHNVTLVDAATYGLQVISKAKEGDAKAYGELWLYALKTTERDTLLVYAYIAKSEAKESWVEEKCKRDEEAARTLKRATRSSNKKEEVPKSSPEVSMEDAPKEKKQGKPRGPSYKLKFDIELATDLKKGQGWEYDNLFLPGNNLNFKEQKPNQGASSPIDKAHGELDKEESQQVPPKGLDIGAFADPDSIIINNNELEAWFTQLQERVNSLQASKEAEVLRGDTSSLANDKRHEHGLANSAVTPDDSHSMSSGQSEDSMKEQEEERETIPSTQHEVEGEDSNMEQFVRDLELMDQKKNLLLDDSHPSRRRGHPQHEQPPSKEKERSKSPVESMEEDVAPRRRRAQISPTPTKRKRSPCIPPHRKSKKEEKNSKKEEKNSKKKKERKRSPSSPSSSFSSSSDESGGYSSRESPRRGHR
ncbi:hypothetical protein L7F22_052287 [Adiantum nelumboides]|nr:hypothetical protein [Adiantum nelumboides]